VPTLGENHNSGPKTDKIPTVNQQKPTPCPFLIFWIGLCDINYVGTEKTTKSWLLSDKKLEFYSLCANFNNIKNLFESIDEHDLTKIKFKSKLFELFQEDSSKQLEASGKKLLNDAFQEKKSALFDF